MKNLTIKAETLANIVKTLSTVINKNSVLPIIECIKFTAGAAIATDLETSMYMAIDWVGQSVAIPSAILLQLLKTLKKDTEISFSVDPQTFQIYVTTEGANGSQITSSKISGENPDDFPTLPKFEPSNTFVLDSDGLNSFYDAIKYVSKDEFMPALCGVYISNQTMIATDKFRMFKKVPTTPMFSNDNDSLILSPRALGLMRRAKVSVCTVNTCKTNTQYTAPGLTVISRNINATYPNVTIRDSAVHTFSADSAAIMQAVNIATLYAPKNRKNKCRPIFMRAQNSLLSVYSADYELQNTACEYVLNMSTSRENYVFCFDGAKAKEMISAMKGDVITFTHSEAGEITISDNAGKEVILMHMQGIEENPIYDIFEYSFEQYAVDKIAKSLKFVNSQLNKYSEQLAVLMESEATERKDISEKINQYQWDLSFQKHQLSVCTNNVQRKPIRKEIEDLERSINYQKMRFDGLTSRKADLQSKIDHYTDEKIKTENELEAALANIPTIEDVVYNCDNVQELCHTIDIDAMIEDMLYTYENMDLSYELPSEPVNIAPLLDIYEALELDYTAPVSIKPTPAPTHTHENAPAVMVNILITGSEQTEVKQADARKTSSLLKKYFKETFGIEISVRSEVYSGGSSLNVSYRLGPDEKTVENICKKLQYGHFDSMTDCAEIVDCEGLIIDGYKLNEYKHVFVSQIIDPQITYKAGLCMSDKMKFFGVPDLTNEAQLNEYFDRYNYMGRARTWQELLFENWKVSHFVTQNASDIEFTQCCDYQNQNGIYFEYKYKGEIYRTDQAPEIKSTKTKTEPKTNIQKQPTTFSASDFAADEIQIIDYSEKSIAVIGNTKPIKEQLKSLGGRFNFRLTCGAGWIFPKSKQAEIMAALQPVEQTLSESLLQDIENSRNCIIKNLNPSGKCNGLTPVIVRTTGRGTDTIGIQFWTDSEIGAREMERDYYKHTFIEVYKLPAVIEQTHKQPEPDTLGTEIEKTVQFFAETDQRIFGVISEQTHQIAEILQVEINNPPPSSAPSAFRQPMTHKQKSNAF